MGLFWSHPCQRGDCQLEAVESSTNWPTHRIQRPWDIGTAARTHVKRAGASPLPDAPELEHLCRQANLNNIKLFTVGKAKFDPKERERPLNGLSGTGRRNTIKSDNIKVEFSFPDDTSSMTHHVLWNVPWPRHWDCLMLSPTTPAQHHDDVTMAVQDGGIPSTIAKTGHPGWRMSG